MFFCVSLYYTLDQAHVDDITIYYEAMTLLASVFYLVVSSVSASANAHIPVLNRLKPL